MSNWVAVHEFTHRQNSFLADTALCMFWTGVYLSVCFYINICTHTHISVQNIPSLHKNIILVLILRNVLLHFISGFPPLFFFSLLLSFFLCFRSKAQNIIFNEKWESSTKEHSGLSF